MGYDKTKQGEGGIVTYYFKTEGESRSEERRGGKECRSRGSPDH